MRLPLSLIVLATTLALAAVGALAVASAPAAPTAANAVDLQLSIGATTTNPFRSALTPVPNGGSVSVSRLDFYVYISVDLITPQAARAKVRFELGGGLRWGPDDPDPGEQCTSTPTTGECETPEMLPISGQSGGGWYWDVVAPQPGTYSFRAEIVEATDTDPDPSNNSSEITIVVTDGGGSGGGGSGGGGTGGGGGGSVSVAAGAANVTPSKPKAGSAVTASVRVSAGGSPVRPAGVACAGAIGSLTLKGTPRAASGAASCTFRTPRSAKGKTLAGSVSFRAGGKRFTKRFTVKLG